MDYLIKVLSTYSNKVLSDHIRLCKLYLKELEAELALRRETHLKEEARALLSGRLRLYDYDSYDYDYNDESEDIEVDIAVYDEYNLD
jgi:hypothetical protein